MTILLTLFIAMLTATAAVLAVGFHRGPLVAGLAEVVCLLPVTSA